jgi:hypothetical protein
MGVDGGYELRQRSTGLLVAIVMAVNGFVFVR